MVAASTMIAKICGQRQGWTSHGVVEIKLGWIAALEALRHPKALRIFSGA